MSGPAEAAKRGFETKTGGSDPESPHKKQASAEEEQDAKVDKDMKQMMKQMMGMMGNLETKMDGVSTKVDDAVQIATEAKDNVKLVETKIEAYQNDMNEVKQNLKKLEVKITENEFKEHGVKKEEWVAWRTGVEEQIAATEFKDPMEELAPDMKQKLYDIEKELANMRSTTKPHTDNQVVTMVVGGVGTTGDEDEAVNWIESQIKSLKISVPDDVYFKGETFKGMLFCKFNHPEAAERAIKELTKRKPEFKTSGSVYKPWYKQDVPIRERAPISFLLGLRWQLGEWGTYDKKLIKVDEKTLIMKVDGKEVAQVSTKPDNLQVDWLDEKWASWKELQESPELKALAEAANKKIGQANGNEAKGKGKGKPLA